VIAFESRFFAVTARKAVFETQPAFPRRHDINSTLVESMPPMIASAMR